MASYKKSENTRELIISTASKLFYEKGYQAATVRDVAREAKLSLSRLNYHFNSKVELAAQIVSTFLINLGDEIRRLDFMEDDRMWCNVVHIRLFMKFLLTENKSTDFLYEMALADNLRKMILESVYRHFRRQAKILGLHRDQQTLRMYAHICVGAMVNLFCAKREQDLAADEKIILDMFNELHLKLLDLSEEKRENYIESAEIYTSRVTFEVCDLIHPRVIYKPE